ncbi:MAG: HepT-like ribonuclease domain-containing protein [Sciscionella sp.]
MRLIEIGEAVRAIDADLLAREPDIPWIDVATMRNHLAHRYFDTAHGIVHATITKDLHPSWPLSNGFFSAFILIPSHEHQHRAQRFRCSSKVGTSRFSKMTQTGGGTAAIRASRLG